MTSRITTMISATVELPIGLHSETTKHTPKKTAILYGPVVLAGALGTENFPETDILDDHLKLNNHPLIDVPDLITDEKDLTKWINPVEGEPLSFLTEAIGQPGDKTLKLIPFYNLHHQRYTLYWNIMDSESYQTFKDEEKEKADRLRAITVDVVNPNEQQPEVEHSLKKKNSRSGYSNRVGSGWRESINEGFFSYEMKVIADKQMYLQVIYNGNDRSFHHEGHHYLREFDILIDDYLIAHQILDKNKPGELFDVCYDIPLSLTNGKEKVEIKFSSKEGKAAGGVYGLRVVNDKGQ